MNSIKLTFGASLRLPSSQPVEDYIDLVVEAEILPGDAGGLHCPPCGPIPEITAVYVDPHADVAGTRYERGEDVLQLLGEKDMMYLEDLALEEAAEQEILAGEQDPPEREYDAYEESLRDEIERDFVEENSLHTYGGTDE